jgi:hypothetical protein
MNNRMAAFDLVGAFILSFLSKRKPRRWATGKLKSSSPSSSLKSLPNKTNSRTIQSVPGLLDLIDSNYLVKKLGVQDTSNVTIIDIFASLRFAGIKKNTDDYINTSMISWSEGKRPFVLMHEIPTPFEVLKQQARGERVVTLFLNKEELLSKHVSKLNYMAGEIEHPRDALEFLLHDLKHMENFVNDETYEEQIGYFKAMASLNKGKPKAFFASMGYDMMLWYELEYCISDMNCYVPHFLHYMLAKLLFATERLIKDQNGIIKEEFIQLACSSPHVSYPLEYKQIATTTTTTSNDINKTLDDNDTKTIKYILQINWNKFLNAIGINKCSNCTNNDCNCAFKVASNMVNVTFGTKHQMTADEGEVLRMYFRNYWQ